MYVKINKQLFIMKNKNKLVSESYFKVNNTIIVQHLFIFDTLTGT